MVSALAHKRGHEWGNGAEYRLGLVSPICGSFELLRRSSSPATKTPPRSKPHPNRDLTSDVSGAGPIIVSDVSVPSKTRSAACSMIAFGHAGHGVAVPRFTLSCLRELLTLPAKPLSRCDSTTDRNESSASSNLIRMLQLSALQQRSCS